MSIEMIELEEFNQCTQIKVIGVGGVGGNAVEHMVAVSYTHLDVDKRQALGAPRHGAP